MTLRRHLSGYAVIGLLQWLVEYGLMLALSEWVMPVEPANVIGRLCGAVLGFWLWSEPLGWPQGLGILLICTGVVMLYS